MHEHFRADAAGELVPCPAAEATVTIVTREPEWDDSARGRAMRLEEHERSIDPETNLPIEVAYAPNAFVVHSDVVNYAAKAIAKVRADDQAAHEDDPRWFDGRRYTAQLHEPDQLPEPDQD